MSRYDRSASTSRVSRRDLTDSGHPIGRPVSTPRGGGRPSLQRPGLSLSSHHQARQPTSIRKFPITDQNRRAYHSYHGTDSSHNNNRQLQQTRVKKQQASGSSAWRKFFTNRLKIPAVEADIKKDTRHQRKKPTKPDAAGTKPKPICRAPPDARVFVANTKRETWHGESVCDDDNASTKSSSSTIQEIHSSFHEKLSRLHDTSTMSLVPSVASTSGTASTALSSSRYSLMRSSHTHKSNYSIKSMRSVAENSLGSNSIVNSVDSMHNEHSIWNDIETIVSCVSDREEYTGSDDTDVSDASDKKEMEGDDAAKVSDDDSDSDYDDIKPDEMLAILTANIHFGGTTPLLSQEEEMAVLKLTAQRRNSRQIRSSKRENNRLSLPKVVALIEDEAQEDSLMINKTQSLDSVGMGSSLYPTIDASEDELSDFDAVLDGFMGVNALKSDEKPQDLEDDTGASEVTDKKKKRRTKKDKKEMTEEEKAARLQRRKERSERKLKSGDVKERKERKSSSRKEDDGKKKKKKRRRRPRSREARREGFRNSMTMLMEANGAKVDSETLQTLGVSLRGFADELEKGTISKDSIEGVAVTEFLDVLKHLTKKVQDEDMSSGSSTSARGA